MEQMNQINSNLKKYRFSISNLIQLIDLFDIEVEQRIKEKKAKQIFNIGKFLGQKRTNSFNSDFNENKTVISKKILKIKEKFNKLVKKDEEFKKIISYQKTLSTINSTITFHNFPLISELDENMK
jgi:hypothetical protein